MVHNQLINKIIAIGYFIAKMFSRCTNGVDGFNVSAYTTSTGCTQALNKLCGYTKNETDKACYDCSASGMNQQKLLAEGCNEYDLADIIQSRMTEIFQEVKVI